MMTATILGSYLFSSSKCLHLTHLLPYVVQILVPGPPWIQDRAISAALTSLQYLIQSTPANFELQVSSTSTSAFEAPSEIVPYGARRLLMCKTQRGVVLCDTTASNSSRNNQCQHPEWLLVLKFIRPHSAARHFCHKAASLDGSGCHGENNGTPNYALSQVWWGE